MKKVYKKLGAVALCVLSITSCDDSFLEPDPLSFYEPNATFTTESGLSAALAQIDRNLKICWASGSDQMAIFNQFQFSETLLIATGNAAGYTEMYEKLDANTVGTSNINDQAEHSILWYWNEGYAGIKYANTVIQYAPQVKGLSEDVLHEYMGRAYFHRSFRYYSLVHEFRNVPLVTKLPEVPKQNYKSTTREAILEMIEEDMEKAVEWVPDQEPGSYTSDYPGGYVNKAACRMLLAKIYMANYKFQEAVEQLNAIEAAGYQLMTEPFGVEKQMYITDTWEIERNVIWDLHRHENVFNPANKETIYALGNSGQNMSGFNSLRAWMPFYFDGKVHAPSGKDDGNGRGPQALTNYRRTSGDYSEENAWQFIGGRGIGSRRPSPWYQHELWSLKAEKGNYANIDSTDLRHNNKVGNWLNMEDLTYNHIDTKKPDANGVVWFGKNLRKYAPGHEGDENYCLCEDTIRRWYNVPLYIFWADDRNCMNTNGDRFNGPSVYNGEGNADLYFYRFAEVLLLRAECNVYLKNLSAAREDLNKIRRRAQCEYLYEGDVTIDDVFDERARELYREEWRHDEMVRASYCIAHSGIKDRAGRTYTLDGIIKEEGTQREGGSWWYQRMHLSLYNDGILYCPNGDKTNYYYTMGKNNIFWPIPTEVITSNNKGVLWQNYGYTGYDENIEVFTDWKEAVADEAKTAN